MQITPFADEEISAIEMAFGFHFGEEERTILNYFETADIQACPGGGKTSTLVAKLILLESRLPFSDGTGICVLTHTNVAIDEIRKRAMSSTKLFADPNYCGTIQSFVDRFLAIPAYARYFKKRPICIDSDLYDKRMEKEWAFLMKSSGPLYPPDRKPLDQQHKQWMNLRFGVGEKTYIFTDGIDGEVVARNPETNRYKQIRAAKLRIMQDGVLHFDDAYYLAETYLNKYPGLSTLFQSRFGMVFIDEMQDTQPHQIKLLERLFSGSRIQRFGDINQTIYEKPKGASGWLPKGVVLELTHSKRLSKSIARAVRHVCHVPHAELGGHDQIAIAPKILVFDDANIQNVLPTFGRLILENELSDDKYPFKAVGRVGIPKDDPKKHTISSYFSTYRKEDSSSQQPNTLRGLLKPEGNPSAAYYQDGVFKALARALFLSRVKTEDGRWYSPQRIRRHLAALHPAEYLTLTRGLVHWCRDLHAGIDASDSIEAFIRDVFLPLFPGISLDADLEDFLVNPASPHVSVGLPTSETNRYVHASPDGKQIEIQLATVHSVKGETHCATLYLESFYEAYDIWEILDVILGEPLPEEGSRPHLRLPIAYVAMTRPTSMLAVAIHRNNKKRVFGRSEALALEAVGWEVIEIH